MAKTKAARSGRKSAKAGKRVTKAAKKRAPKAAKKRAAKAPKRAVKKKAPKRPARKTAPKRAKLSKKASKKTGKKAPAMKPRARKAPGRKPAAPKARGKSPVRKASKPARKPLPRNARTAKLNAEAAKKQPALNRERRRLAENDEEMMPSAPSTLGYASGSSAARSGRGELREALSEHTETSPALTGGDVDADWEDAYATGDESPGGDNPTPDQDRVDDIGKALGVQYNDNEELKGSEKIIERDRHRWELDPASSDDYKERSRDDE